jgi:photosystem II stability/assembly factor-like uncharacterized protein
MSSYFDPVEAELTEVTDYGAYRRAPDPERGSRPRERRGQPRPRGRPPARATTGGRGPRPPRRKVRRPASEALAILAGLAVVAAIVAIVRENFHHSKPHRAAVVANRHTATATRAHPSPAPGKPKPTGVSVAMPANFHPRSFTAIGELTWWLLGPAPCPSTATKSPCGSIVRTTDGGRNFAAVPSPNAALANDQNAPGYSQLRFSDLKNGFAFGPNLYATHDAGKTWQPVDLNGKVTELAISAGEAYATVEPAGGGNARLVQSPASHDDWSTVPAAGAVSGGLWVQGSDVIVQSGAGTGTGGNVLVSHDAGQTFSASPAPSPGLACQFAAPQPPVVWARCATGSESGVWRSTDGGAHFTVAVGTGTSLPLPNSAVFAAASATTAAVAYQKMYRTRDGGSLWDSVTTSGVAQWAYLGFTDETRGAGLGYVGSIAAQNERLFYTNDGGRSYHPVQLP